MRRLLLILLGVFWAVPSMAAITVVGTPQTVNGIDPVMTFDSAPSTTQHVLIFALVANVSGTLDLIDISVTETSMITPLGQVDGGVKVYAFCYAGDGSDSTVTLDGSASVRAVGVVIDGGSCTPDGSSSANEFVNTTTQALTIDLTTTQSGSFMLGFAAAGFASFTTAGSFTPIPSTNATIGNKAQGQYRVLASAGTYDVSFTSAAAAWGVVAAFAVKEAGGGGGGPPPAKSLLLGGVGVW